MGRTEAEDRVSGVHDFHRIISAPSNGVLQAHLYEQLL